jgi:glycosyltransferase involved in cell wall biosynthesis
MRIAFVSDSYKPYVSGVTHCITLWKRVLEGWGHEVYVFSFGDPSFDPRETNVVYSPGIALPNGFFIGAGFSRQAQSLLKNMDVVHLNHPFLTGPYVARMLSGLNVPLVFTNHTRYDLYFDYYFPFLSDKFQKNVLRRALHSFYQKVDRIIFPSRSVLEMLSHLNLKVQGVIIPNGVEVERLRGGQKERCSLYKPLQGKKMVLFLGRLSAEKNARFVLQAFLNHLEDFPDTCLVFAGDGRERGVLEQMVAQKKAREHVIFAGKISYDQVPDYLALADVFVTASLSEVHPLTVMEAQAAGVPVVAVHAPGVDEIVRDGETGFLTTLDEEEFAQKLALLCGDASLRQKFRLQTLTHGETFRVEYTVQRLLEEYERLME